MPREKGVFYDHHPGPWLSLGVHVDWQAPHVAIHFLHWIITVGRQYRSSEDASGTGVRLGEWRLGER